MNTSRVRFFFLLVAVFAALQLGTTTPAWGNVIALRVDATAPEGGDGQSWQSALRSLQDAIGIADGRKITEIWVAAGTYLPDDGVQYMPGDRTASFNLRNGVGIYGGFYGTELIRSHRNTAVNITILSGDLAGDDDTGGSTSDNSENIVRAAVVNTTAILDGFRLTGGNGDCGAALWISAAAPAIRDCEFVENEATAGGALCLEAGAFPTLDACRFNRNEAFNGGAVYLDDQSGLVASRCTFERNEALRGAGVFMGHALAYFANCTWAGNAAAVSGGGIHAEGGALFVVNSVMSGNTAGNGAGLFAVNGAGIQVENATVAGNMAAGNGGGVFVNTTDDLVIRNSILWGNFDSQGSSETAQLQLANAILSIDFTTVEGWTGAFGGTANNGDDPAFVNPLGSDGEPGTADDDLRVSAGSPAIDAGSNALAPLDAADLDDDDVVGELIPFDLGGGPRFLDDPLTTPDPGEGDAPVIDRGAHEYGEDCNGNGIPDVIEIEEGLTTDCNENGIPDECDIFNCQGMTSCDDCNLNRLPDQCDIDSGNSEDENGDGVPDECVFFLGGVNGRWSSPENWSSGQVPDGGGPAHVTVDGADAEVLVDLPVSVETLRLGSGATVRVTEPCKGCDLTVNSEGGILNNGTILVDSVREIRAEKGPLVMGGDSMYKKDPESTGPVSATLMVGDVLMLPTTCGIDEQMTLSDDMRLIVSGDFIMDGTSAPGCGTIAGGQTPPILQFIANAVLTVDGSIEIIDGAQIMQMMSALAGGEAFQVVIEFTKDFRNFSKLPELFRVTDVGIAWLGNGTFEVAGLDVGPFEEGFGTEENQNFSHGLLDIGSEQSVIFANTFNNSEDAGPCREAIYIRSLQVGANTSVLLDEVRVYYESLSLSDGAEIVANGCGEFVELCPFSLSFLQNASTGAQCLVRDYMEEFAAFQNCFGTDLSSACCASLDLDGSDEIDHADYQAWLTLITGEGECCEGNATCGCNQPNVQACVCEIDPSCCTDEWIPACAQIATDSCNACP